jgi:hypothetical protein
MDTQQLQIDQALKVDSQLVVGPAARFPKTASCESELGRGETVALAVGLNEPLQGLQAALGLGGEFVVGLLEQLVHQAIGQRDIRWLDSDRFGSGVIDSDRSLMLVQERDGLDEA